MTILFAGGDESAFTKGTNAATKAVSVVTDAGTFRTTHSKCALRCFGRSSNYFINLKQQYNTPIWFSARLKTSPASGSAPDNRFLSLRSSTNGTAVVFLWLTNPAIVDFNRSSFPIPITNTITPPAQSAVNRLLKYDVHINYNSVGGFIKIYIDSVLWYSSGSSFTISPGINSFDIIELGSAYPLSTDYTDWSEVIVSDEDTRSFGLVSLLIVSSTTQGTWSLANQVDLNKTTQNDTTFISANVTAQTQEYAVDTSLLTPDLNLRSVLLTGRTRALGQDPAQSLKLGLKSAASSYSNSAKTLTSSFSPVQEVYDKASSVPGVISAVDNVKDPSFRVVVSS